MRRLRAATAAGCIDAPAPTARNRIGWAVAAAAHHIRSRLSDERPRLLHCIWSLGLVALVTACGELIGQTYVRPTQLSLMYLLAVFVAAIRLGLWPALLASIVSVAALDYLFIPPLYSFETNTPQDALLLVFLSIGAVIASGIAARLREQVGIAERNAETTAALYRFAGKLAGTVTLDAAAQTVIDQFGLMLPHRAVIVLDAKPAASAPLTFPLRSSGETIGMLRVTPHGGSELSEDDSRLIAALAELAGIAIGRQVLADRLAQLGIEQAADRLRSALLNSIAHDLTAPIASVATALTSLSQDYDAFDDSTRRELVAEAEREAEHLHQFSAKLIHIARLESGAIDLQRKPSNLDELVDATMIRAHGALGPRRVVIDIPDDLPPLDVDPVLIEQALFHILENAAKYTPEDAAVTIAGTVEPDGITVRISDEGPGFPATDSERIFSKFYRANPRSDVGGTGLGLAICRGFIEAHGGAISAANRTDRNGAVFTITLPEAHAAAGAAGKD
jgi:two-component system sensor histidine kinase KdpD